MARTKHHNDRRDALHGRDPAWYRRQDSRLFRARTKQLVRVGRHDVLPLLKRKVGYYW